MKSVLFKIIFVISFAVLVTSCDVFDHLINRDRWIKRDGPIETVLIPEPITVSNDSGDLGGDVKGIEPKKLVTFTDIGQEYTIKNGEELKLTYSENINFAYTTFDVTENDDNSITINLVDKDTSRIFIKNKCQIIRRNGIDIIPKIEVAKDLDPEQVIITPIFDDNCIKLGYVVRYGSIETVKGKNGTAGGCREGKKVYNNYKNCIGGKTIKEEIKETVKETKKLDDDCSLCRKLGLPCGCTK